jgi:excisionase family DNA binding protein
MKKFLNWLKQALMRLDRLKDSLSSEPWAMPPQDVFKTAGSIAVELGRQAAVLGLGELVAEAAELEGATEPDAVRALVAKSIAACDKAVGGLLTEPQAAEFLSISPRKMWELGSSGEIPRVPIGKAVRYHLADLEAWIEKQKAA